ncbi:MAG: hypothetical protein A3I07_02015 [Candidatus Doudnabacteria bacterium RIFCSPLOWO2_02_FULL_42_9]|uniref:Helix-turn-helix domain-containing protein n=1 Tax=Candidatus Doudnabacteria bacterium RIFCSPHIGHO2_01_FULL_41_86 TaxID=1817821 RepID=A0A1F5N842_9BACT|nr:MAG: hypothetical protein A2717_03660 [Candidatus Doudnabacteria bacterium RIFCSPHIGHO2_01_FULL_41_86]OGE74771.1 MAG: hypothetical protein A3K07_03255 [Candidatus Doudnabacteria bacterium RIFCSPHIGHO2_01_43_10]OGE85738.1 MAG: hypothetical protein A3E28_02990 [Candidatus Doudnabacteria bacterium RIFCSPHIGHO2_12_FULL_42_22]OGE87234.1 MAG: hypothetical protein A3C49_00620 [Candidatus Doudnabacteria bacterium RIFCSPHIGHO2_02_FULL_42_25]OGE92071.1 MAG: hypothetical protein A2895_00495 [Candidatus
MNSQASDLELLSLKDASSLSPYSADYLNLLARKGKIRARKIGRDWVITKSDLFDYLQKQKAYYENRLSKFKLV